MFDLNDLFAKNFTGDVKQLDLSYPEPITQNLTEYPLRAVRYWQEAPVIGNMAPFIPFCMLGNQWSDPPKWGSEYTSHLVFYQGLSLFCTLFRPSLTDQGICYTFNGVRSEDNMKGSSYMTSFKEVFGLPDNAYFKEPYIAKGVRIQNGLRLVLDAHTLTGNFKDSYKTDNSFTISLQHSSDFPLPVTEGLEVRGGFKTRYDCIVSVSV